MQPAGIAEATGQSELNFGDDGGWEPFKRGTYTEVRYIEKSTLAISENPAGLSASKDTRFLINMFYP